MDPAIVERLVTLNREFYTRFATEFADSRSRLNDGILEVFRAWGSVDSLLDLGCGDARVGHAWVDGALGIPWIEGRSRYLGVDNAGALLDVHAPPALEGWAVRPVELVPAPDLDGERFSHVVSFSVLHHVPGEAARLAFVRALRAALAPGGHWAVSVWQVLDRPRFRSRIVPWSEIGLDPDAVDPRDVIIDWKRGGRGLRYVHDFERAELVSLCEDNGLKVDSVGWSDGRSGDLGLYCRGRAA